MKQYHSCTMIILVLSLLSITGCRFQGPNRLANLQAATPEEAVLGTRPHGPQRPKVVNEVKVLGTRTVDNRTIVIYQAREQAGIGGQDTLLGWGIAERGAQGWSRISGSEVGVGDVPSPELFVDYGSGAGVGPPEETYLFGRALTPPVAQVEVSLATGEVLRDTTLDGVFMLYTATLVKMCELRIVDTNGVIVRRVDLQAQQPAAVQNFPPGTCPS